MRSQSVEQEAGLVHPNPLNGKQDLCVRIRSTGSGSPGTRGVSLLPLSELPVVVFFWKITSFFHRKVILL